MRRPIIGEDRIAASKRLGCRARQINPIAPPIECAINSRGNGRISLAVANAARSPASRSKFLARGRVARTRGRQECPCPRQSRHQTSTCFAAKSRIVSKCFSTNSPKPPRVRVAHEGVAPEGDPSGGVRRPGSENGPTRNQRVAENALRVPVIRSGVPGGSMNRPSEQILAKCSFSCEQSQTSRNRLSSD